jgi:hypothetical protein
MSCAGSYKHLCFFPASRDLRLANADGAHDTSSLFSCAPLTLSQSSRCLMCFKRFLFCFPQAITHAYNPLLTPSACSSHDFNARNYNQVSIVVWDKDTNKEDDKMGTASLIVHANGDGHGEVGDTQSYGTLCRLGFQRNCNVFELWMDFARRWDSERPRHCLC